MAERTNRREVILDKAARLFATKGVAATTVREIADGVGVLSGSLYHHFESKDAIVDELLRSYLDELHTRYHEASKEELDPRSRIERLVRVSMEVVVAHPYATEIYQNNFNLLVAQPRFAYLKVFVADTRKIWMDAIHSGLDSGLFRTDIDPQTLYRIIRDVVWLSVRWQKPSNQALVTRAEECASVFLDGISVRPAARRRSKTG
jgi:TetR/AcrR family transcriptional regulator, cholesterol catabolism regulator